MKDFPDEAAMEQGQNGDPIRGGSIGLNRVLGRFVSSALTDSRPQFRGVIISAFTIFRNVWTMKKDATMSDLEKGFVTDVNLFLDYFDTYLSHVWRQLDGNKNVPVVVYFPDYKAVSKELLREHTGQNELMFKMYQAFLGRHGHYDESIRKLERCQCFWVKAGGIHYPHKDVAQKFREIASHSTSLYATGDPVALMTNIPLDLHIAGRIRGIHLLESYTAKVKTPDEFRFRLDKEGRIPFQPAVHVVFGDDILFKPQITPKIRKQLLEDAVKDRWLTRSEEDIRHRLAKVTEMSASKLKSFDFV